MKVHASGDQHSVKQFCTKSIHWILLLLSW